MNILVTGVGGPAPRSFVRAVKLSGNSFSKSVRFIGVDCNPLAYGFYDQSLFDHATSFQELRMNVMGLR